MALFSEMRGKKFKSLGEKIVIDDLGIYDSIIIIHDDIIFISAKLYDTKIM